MIWLKEQVGTKCKKCRFLKKMKVSKCDNECLHQIITGKKSCGDLFYCRRETEPHDGCDDKLISGEYVLEEDYEDIVGGFRLTVTAKESKIGLTLTVKELEMAPLFGRYPTTFFPTAIRHKAEYLKPGDTLKYNLREFRPRGGKETADVFGVFVGIGKEVFFRRV